MKRFFYLFIAVALLASCGGSGSEIPGKPDSSGTSSGSVRKFEDTAAKVVDALKGLGDTSAVNTAPTGNFSERYAAYLTAIFGDEFKETEMDAMEMLPRFKESKSSRFRKMIRREPIDGGKMIPRLVFRGYLFKDEATLKQQVEEWMNGTESSSEKIALGEPVKAFKAASAVIAIRGAEMYMLDTPCIFEGNDMNAVRERFMKTFEGGETRWRLSITCKAGEIVYQ